MPTKYEKTIGEKKLFYGWIVVLASFLSMLVVGLIYSYGVFVKPLTQEFGWSRASISLAFSISIFLSTMSLPLGRMSDLYGVRKVVAIGAFLTGGGLLLSSQVTSLVEFCIYIGIAGFGISALYVPPVSAIARWFEKGKGMATGFAVSALSGGMALFPPVIGMLIEIFGWRTTFLILGILVLLLLSISSFLIRHEPKTLGLTPYGGDIAAKNERPVECDLKSAMGKKPFWYIYLVMVFTHISLFLVTVHVVPHAIGLGINEITASTALTLLGICSMLARIIGGAASDKLSTTNLFTIFIALQSIATFLLFRSGDIWIIYLAMVLMGIGFGGWIAIYPIIVRGFFGTKHIGSILGTFDSGVGLGGLIGPYLGGLIFDSVKNYDLAFLLGGTICALAVVFSALLRKEKI
ncbi:MAG: MFS transporter [Candidatus Hadarchaeum sp.]|uniref:MFS transporter n=1 Tax=Candidatus Hadarchaeum sp. TaxID=2883567 RepID=UPI003D0D7DFE